MKTLWHIALRSAWHRRFGLGIVVLAVALSTFLLLAVERLRVDVRENFSSAVSGTDLIVGPRTGATQLMLYAVFRIGSATNNMRWSSVQALAQDKAVKWVVPISLGDSHRGFSVVGTTPAYFEHFRFGDAQALVLQQGRPFEGVFDAVLGADVADRLGYGLKQRLVLSHGDGLMPANDHADMPFTVVGILARTGTPVDRGVHISLAGMEAIHGGWTPKQVTAVLVGLNSRAAVFSAARRVAEFDAEPLMAVLPGVAMDELWETVGMAERTLRVMGMLVAVVSLAGMAAVVVTSLEQRRRELAVLRAVGAGPRQVFGLLLLEGGLVAALGATLGIALCLLALAGLAPWLQAQWGLNLSWSLPGPTEAVVWGGVVLAGTLASLLPGWRAYRLSLADGLTPKG
jgi:putative ABC transport system permease protein